jgi:hypothetical protein
VDPYVTTQKLPSTQVKGVLTEGNAAVTGCAHSLSAAQSDADARAQLRYRERLGEVVVRTRIKGLHLVTLLHSPGDHDDGRIGELADQGNQQQSVGIGQTKVEKNEVGIPGSYLGQR